MKRIPNSGLSCAVLYVCGCLRLQAQLPTRRLCFLNRYPPRDKEQKHKKQKTEKKKNIRNKNIQKLQVSSQIDPALDRFASKQERKLRVMVPDPKKHSPRFRYQIIQRNSEF